jgi:hypothetical protein
MKRDAEQAKPNPVHYGTSGDIPADVPAKGSLFEFQADVEMEPERSDG